MRITKNNSISVKEYFKITNTSGLALRSLPLVYYFMSNKYILTIYKTGSIINKKTEESSSAFFKALLNN